MTSKTWARYLSLNLPSLLPSNPLFYLLSAYILATYRLTLIRSTSLDEAMRAAHPLDIGP